jgi:2-polyprenyl-3-methyl-5-hydroxy-6-metoxy-1,4-benzoquinol methylase
MRLAQQQLSGADSRCPYCESPMVEPLHRRYLVLEVRQCGVCGLMFRYPKAEPQQATAYYDSQYDDFEQGCGTTLPAPAEVERLKREGFGGTAWDASARLDLVRSLKPSGRFLDFGCSWGYVLPQAKAAGYDASGFEISHPRAAFGRQAFGLDIIDNPAQLERVAGTVDVIYASHVLEHLPTITHTFTQLHHLLSDTGMLVAFVPNCGGELARRYGINWGAFANEAHTISYDAAFFEKNLPRDGFNVRCFSSPYPGTELSSNRTPTAADQEGEALLLVATKR